jgi:hypothetical protein
VSGDQPAVSSRVSSRPEFGDPEGPRRDPVGTVREHDDGSRAVKVTDGLTTHPWCSVTPRGTVWLADEDVAEWGTEREWRLEELRAKLADQLDGVPGSVVFGHVHTTDDDMQAFVELPDCLACEGTGKDQHSTPFEAPLAVHFAAPEVEIAGRRRQLCLWCGHVLLDVPIADGQAAWPPWPKASLVRVEDGHATLQPYTYGEPLPPGCCALPDDQDQADEQQAFTDANSDPEEEAQLAAEERAAADEERADAIADGWDPATDLDDEEGRAADWPAEEADRG